MNAKKEPKGSKKISNELSDSETKLLDSFLNENSSDQSSQSHGVMGAGKVDGDASGSHTQSLRSEKGVDKYLAVGKLLADARRIKKVSLKDVADEIRTRVEILQMIEDGKYEEVSQITYYYGCVGSFARYLSVDHDVIFDYLLKDDEAYAMLVGGENSLVKDGDYIGTRRFRGSQGFASFKYMFAILVAFVAVLCLFSFLNFKQKKDMKQKISIEELMS